MYKLEYYVPVEHLETVNQALFAAGGGRIGQYDCCCWVTEGTGQYRPLEGSNPYLGRPLVIEKVREFKVEMVVEDDKLAAVRRVMVEVHPYETPAYQLWRVEAGG